MDILKVFLTSILSIAALFVLTKLIGNKQISQMNMFDYINGITIGSIAAELATSLENDFFLPLLAMAVYALAAFGISLLTTKSMRARKFLTGKALIIFDNGRLNDRNIAKARLDTNEFLMLCRIQGYFNLSDIQTAILEPNGELSILPVALKRPATPEDLNLSPQQEKIVANVILDGKPLPLSLKAMGFNETWLRDRLKEQGLGIIGDIALATVDDNGSLSVYHKAKRSNKQDIFE